MACSIKESAVEKYLKNNKNNSTRAEAEQFADDFANMYEYVNGKFQLKYTPPVTESHIQDIVTRGVSNMNRYASNFIAMGIIPTMVSSGTPLAEQVHKWASENVPLYKNTTELITEKWQDTKWIRELRTAINPAGNYHYGNLNKMMSAYVAAKQDNIDKMDITTKELNTALEKAYSKKDIAKLDDILAKSGYFYLAYDDIALRLVKNETTIEDEIKKLEATLDTKYIKDAENQANLYLGKNTVGKLLPSNLSEQGLFSNVKDKVEALTALKALKMIEGSQDLLIDLYTKNNDIYTKIVGLSVSMKSIADEILKFNGDVFNERGNYVQDIPTVDYEIVAVTETDMLTKQFSSTQGWKILRNPVKGKTFGLVYRENIQTIQDGIGINVSYAKTGISVSNYVKSPEYENNKDNAFVMSGSKKVLYLTAEEKEILKFENNPIKSIMKSYAHKELIRETQIIRDTVLNTLVKDYTGIDAKEIDKELLEQIEDNMSHPVFLNTGDMSLEVAVKNGLISPKVAREYMPIKDSKNTSLLSDIAGFKDNITYVRKDLGFYVVGYKDMMPFNSYNIGLTISRIKDIVRWLKINTIIVNPVKITTDFTSAMTLALSQGASVQEIVKYTKEANKLHKEMSDLRSKRILLTIDYRTALANKEEARQQNLRKQIMDIEDEIAKHPFSGALANGFINSLSTELLSKERESFKGLNVAMERMIEKLLKDENEDFTAINTAIKKFASAGFNIEIFYEGLSRMLENTTYGDNFSKALKEVANDMRNIKNKDDMTDYLQQYLLAPNSVFVRLGSAATLYADLIPRWVMYRHEINKLNHLSNDDLAAVVMVKETSVNDKSKFTKKQQERFEEINNRIKENRDSFIEELAAIHALTSLLDYKMNLPEGLKFLSDIYAMPYPTFFVRIQRVLLNLLVKTPISFMANLFTMELTGAEGLTILGSNIFNKLDKGTVFTTLFDALGEGRNVVPFGNVIPI